MPPVQCSGRARSERADRGLVAESSVAVPTLQVQIRVAMASIEITRHDLTVRMRGVDAVCACRTHLSVPLAHVVGVRTHAPEADFDAAIVGTSRGVGTYLRRRIAAGSLQLADGQSFYFVRDPRQAIVIDLEEEPFRHIAVQVDGESPEAAAWRVQTAIDSHAAASDARAGTPGPLRPLPALSAPHQDLAGWKRTLAVATAIMLAPLAVLTLVFVAPVLLPALVLGYPMFVHHGARDGCTRFPPARLAS